MQTRRALLLAASLGLVMSCESADMSDPSGGEQEGTGVKTPSGSDSSEGDSDSPVSKINLSDGVKAALSRGEAQDLIVTLNDSGVRNQKSKVSGLKSLRAAVMKDLAGFRASLAREYTHIPYVVVSAKDIAVLDALEASGNVTGVFDNEVFKPASAQALAAINWTPVGTTGDGSGATFDVAILDSQVAHDFGASVVEYKPLGDTDDDSNESTHGDAMVATILTVAPGVTVHAYDVYHNGTEATAATVLTGLDAVFDDLGTTDVKAVNLSFEGSLSGVNANCDTNSLHAAIQALVDADVAVVAAAGNGGNNTQIATPACDSLVISVGATFDANLASNTTYDTSTGTCSNTTTTGLLDSITCFSNYSSRLTLLAPGAEIALDWDGTAGTDNSPTYGTSYAAAFVTGAIAVLADKYDVEDPKWLKDRLALSTNAFGVGGRPITGAPKYVLDVGAADDDVCLATVDDNSITVAAGGDAAIDLSLEFNKASCNVATAGITGLPTWLTVVTAGTTDAGTLVQDVTLAATTTTSKAARYATVTCPNTDAFGSDKNLARCILLSASASPITADDEYVVVTQTGDNAAPSDVNASVAITDGGDGIFETAEDTDTNTAGLQAAVTITVNSVTDGAATSGFTYCVTTSSSAAGCVYEALTVPSTINKTVTLLSGDGVTTVYFYVQDPALNRAAAKTDTTIVDTQAPANGTLTVTSENAQVALSFAPPAVVGSPYTAATLRRSSAITHPTTGSPTTPVLPTCTTGDPVTTTWTSPFTGTLTVTDTAVTTDGTVTYYYIACITDQAGNTSAGATASARPRTDVDAPVLGGVLPTTVAGVTGTLAQLVTAKKCVDNAAPAADLCFTNTDITVELTGITGTPTEYCFSTTQNGCTSNSGTWAAIGSGTVAIDAEATPAPFVVGSRTYYWFVRDAAKNVSASKTFQIYYDISAPPLGRMSATPGILKTDLAWAGALDTASRNASYKLVGLKGTTAPAEKCTDGVEIASGFTPVTVFPTHSDDDGVGPGTAALTAGDTWTYRVCLTDRAGNTNVGMTVSSVIRPELDGPVPLATNSLRVIAEGCDAISTENACELANCHWRPAVTAPTAAPAACVANMTRLGGSAWTRVGGVRVWAAATDVGDVAAMLGTTKLEVCASANTVLAKNCMTWRKYDEIDEESEEGIIASLSGDGEKYVSTWVRDSWGNISDSSSAAGSQPYRDKIGIDRTPPTAGTIATNAMTAGKITVSVSGITDDGTFARGLNLESGNQTVEIYYREGTTAPGTSTCLTRPAASRVCKADMTTGGNASCEHASLTAGDKYSYRVCASDGIGNWNRGVATTAATTVE